MLVTQISKIKIYIVIIWAHHLSRSPKKTIEQPLKCCIFVYFWKGHIPFGKHNHTLAHWLIALSSNKLLSVHDILHSGLPLDLIVVLAVYWDYPAKKEGRRKNGKHDFDMPCKLNHSAKFHDSKSDRYKAITWTVSMLWTTLFTQLIKALFSM